MFPLKIQYNPTDKLKFPYTMFASKPELKFSYRMYLARERFAIMEIDYPDLKPLLGLIKYIAPKLANIGTKFRIIFNPNDVQKLETIHRELIGDLQKVEGIRMTDNEVKLPFIKMEVADGKANFEISDKPLDGAVNYNFLGVSVLKDGLLDDFENPAMMLAFSKMLGKLKGMQATFQALE